MKVVRIHNDGSLQMLHLDKHKETNNKTKLIIGIIFLILLCVGVGTVLYFFVFTDGKDKNNKEITTNNEENTKSYSVEETSDEKENDKRLEKILNENKELEELIEKLTKEKKSKKKKEKTQKEENKPDESELIKNELLKELTEIENNLKETKKTTDSSHWENIDKAVLGINTYSNMIQSTKAWNVVYGAYLGGDTVLSTCEFIKKWFSDGYDDFLAQMEMKKVGAQQSAANWLSHGVTSLIGYAVKRGKTASGVND